MRNKSTKKNGFTVGKVSKKFISEHLTPYSGLTAAWNYITVLGLPRKINSVFSTVPTNATRILNVQIFSSVVLASLAGVHRLRHIEKFTQDPLVLKLLNMKKGIDEDSIKGRLSKLGNENSFKQLVPVGFSLHVQWHS
jgi:hypothetical protein